MSSYTHIRVWMSQRNMATQAEVEEDCDTRGYRIDQQWENHQEHTIWIRSGEGDEPWHPRTEVSIIRLGIVCYHSRSWYIKPGGVYSFHWRLDPTGQQDNKHTVTHNIYLTLSVWLDASVMTPPPPPELAGPPASISGNWFCSTYQSS